MKILYVKINSERSKEFQLKTIIYEEYGQKYVKKEAITQEAIPHLKRMQKNYNKLAASIVNPHIKLAKIIAETEDTLTFEFIEGESLERQYNQAKNLGKGAALIDKYKKLLHEGFNTIPFDVDSMANDEFKTILGDFDYSQFQGKPCFQSISNIDLIFSNIIFRNDDIYLIDYEWVYNFNIPVDFSIFRALHIPNDLHWDMEKHYVFKMVADQNSFLKVQEKYQHTRITVADDIKRKNAHIKNMDLIIADKESIILDKDTHIESFEKKYETIVYNKDTHINSQEQEIKNLSVHNAHLDKHINELKQHIQELTLIAESMRIKSRIKRFIKIFIPNSIWNALKSFKHPVEPKQNPSPLVENNYVYLEPSLSQDIQKEMDDFKEKPLISIIMPVYNVSPQWLDFALKSVKSQWYGHWELCIVDDKSTDKSTRKYLKKINHSKIKVKFLNKNLNISGASNAALEMTIGTYIALMDNDDTLTPDALYEVVKAINKEGAEFIYSDEDKIEMDGTYSDPHFKPNFSPDLFLSQNYLSHLGVIKKELISKVGGFTLGLEGSQDFDLYLKVLEHTNKIYHVQKVLYHWRKIPGSTASEYSEKSYAQNAGRKALENAMERRGILATVKDGQTPGTYKVDYSIIGSPLVSIIIPFKDKPELLKVCVESILKKSTYKNFEVIGISNNSTEQETFDEMGRLQSLDTRIKFYEYNVPFNYSDINNYAVNTYAKGEQILFLNNDIEIISKAWIEEMLMYSQQAKNGAIGSKLYFPNDTIQHAGLVIVPKTIHSVILIYQGFPRDHYGYISKLRCVNNYSALTAACLMVKKSIFDNIGGFDAKNLSIAYNDVDLCLRIKDKGYNNIWTPYCEAYHHESISRGHETSVADVERREKEKWHLKNKHQKIFSTTDPYYNRNLTRFGVGLETDALVMKGFEKVQGVPFTEEIHKEEVFSEKNHTSICLFAHFDAQGEVKENVLYYLKSLAKFTDIILISTSEHLPDEVIEKVKHYCRSIIVKNNYGYDFGAWKTGLDYLGSKLQDYEQLILVNDSVYGPLFDLESIFTKMKHYDVWSMTDNHEIEYHLQSYFMVYRKKAFTHPLFIDFWEHFKVYLNKQILIENNEIGFSQTLLHSTLHCGVHYSTKDKHYTNVLQYHWDTLISKHQFPFIKKEVLERNPLQLDIENWKEVISSSSDYPTELIENNL